MKCCTPHIIPFESQAITVINYTSTLRANFGNVPNIEIMYRQPDGTYTRAEVQITLKGVIGDSIKIDHGGTATGYIKLSA